MVAATPQAPTPLKLGAKSRFWVGDLEQWTFSEITATLEGLGQHVQMWVEEGRVVDREALARSIATFDGQIYPTSRAYFGSEWKPGIDGDPRLVVLNASIVGAAGYFGSANEYSRTVNPYSNEREMFVMNLDALTPGTAGYDAVLAHELQHMIHWNMDSNEDAWLNEGASELAEEVNGFSLSHSGASRFQSDPDVQLSTWETSDEKLSAHYGASFLMLSYLLERYGPEFVRDLVAEQGAGVAGLDAVLGRYDAEMTFDELFADWLVANYLDAPALGDGRYGYRDRAVRVDAEAHMDDYPASYHGEVHQYAGDYIELSGLRDAAVRVSFVAEPRVKLVSNDPPSGRYQWWSNRGDASHSWLARSFDLSEVTSATLSFDLWFDIEAGWDYVYLRASKDGSQTWELLRGDHTVDYDPVGNALGPAYTGQSGVPIEVTDSGEPVSGSDPSWVRERISLDALCGHEIVLRFDYVTDDAVNEAGLCLDNLAIESIGFADDAEECDGAWRAAGFLRHDNWLPQRYIVQVIELGESPRVERIEVGPDGRGSTIISTTDGSDKAVLIVAAVAPVTTERASYRLDLERLPQPGG